MPGMPSSPFSPFLPNWRDRLQTAMRDARYNKRTLSIAAGLGETTVSEWLNEKKRKTPSMPSIAKVAAVLGIPVDHFVRNDTACQNFESQPLAAIDLSYAKVRGDLEAGTFREANVYAVWDDAVIPAVPHPDFAGIRQHAWKVTGSSMNKVAKDGTYVVGVNFYDISKRRTLQDGDIVVCERKRGNLVEYTLKRARRIGDTFRLDPESDDPAHANPVWVSTEETGEEDTVTATHLVIGCFTFLV